MNDLKHLKFFRVHYLF